MNFFYEVRLRYYIQPSFALSGMGTETDEEKSEEQRYYREEIHLKKGGQDYDVWAGQKSRSFTIFLISTKNIFTSYTYWVSSPKKETLPKMCR
ncbi:hypothetical protein J7S75_17275 [Providencia huaxiensis]|uniref:Uncharacterized protein n=1 Tax=Providencia huaxiensis TaxID=2027290 RepID=A0A8I2DCJ0_9GAMM|nr:hypothetical protein [Providencia huaxiensis]MBQ0270222.1 hypothetical protein [Providencia huaxiensis]MBQ0536086.1 hypothetical protein [Providencia huaxiensis]MBQ0589200.1 hypothetical protein [Providencia huaxiensis]